MMYLNSRAVSFWIGMSCIGYVIGYFYNDMGFIAAVIGLGIATMISTFI